MKNHSKSKRNNKKKKIAIIGGGISGLYAAWRILNADGDKYQVDIFEATDHIGGRIWSQQIPGLPFSAELGAMRFRPNHQLLKSIIDEFKIPTRKFDVAPPIFHLRGRKLTINELVEGHCKNCGAGMPFNLLPHEKKQSPSDLVRNAINLAIKSLSFPTLKQNEAQRLIEKLTQGNRDPHTWAKVKRAGRHQDLPLYDIGFWNLLQHYLSNEAFVLLHDTLSLESVLGNWNSAEAIPWFLSDFASDELLMVPGGMQTIISNLKKNLEGLGVSFHILTPIKQLIQKGDKTWTLTTDKGKTVESDITFLALPKFALNQLIIKNNDCWPPEWNEGVRAHRLFKLFLVYEDPWWMGDLLPGYDTGRVFTDLPLRQIYYFSPHWMQTCNNVAYGNKRNDKGNMASNWSLLMASYSDEHYVHFWGPLLSEKATSHDKPYYRTISNHDGLEKKLLAIPSKLRAHERMVEKVSRQLIEIHGDKVPKPIIGIYKDWGSSPYGGGWHTWEVGIKPWEVQEQLNNRMPNLFICGESFSTEQGWIEGALKSTEISLKCFGISEPQFNVGKLIDFEDYLCT